MIITIATACRSAACRGSWERSLPRPPRVCRRNIGWRISPGMLSVRQRAALRVQRTRGSYLDLTRSNVDAALKAGLQACGWDASKHSTQSLRSGGGSVPGCSGVRARSDSGFWEMEFLESGALPKAAAALTPQGRRGHGGGDYGDGRQARPGRAAAGRMIIVGNHWDGIRCAVSRVRRQLGDQWLPRPPRNCRRSLGWSITGEFSP